MNILNKWQPLVIRPLYGRQNRSFLSLLLRKQYEESPKYEAVLHQKSTVYAYAGRRKIHSGVIDLEVATEHKDKLTGTKEFIIEDLKEEDLLEAKTLIAESYTSRNPLCSMLHMSFEDHMEILNESVHLLVGNKVSIVARDRNTKKIVGTCFPSIHSRSDNIKVVSTKNYSKNLKVQHCLHIVELLKTSVNIFEKYSEVNKYLEPSLTAIDPNFSGKGLFKALNSEIIKRGKMLGCQLIVGQPTSGVIQGHSIEFGATLEFELHFGSIEIAGTKILDLERNLGISSFKVFSYPL